MHALRPHPDLLNQKLPFYRNQLACDSHASYNLRRSGLTEIVIPLWGSSNHGIAQTCPSVVATIWLRSYVISMLQALAGCELQHNRGRSTMFFWFDFQSHTWHVHQNSVFLSCLFHFCFSLLALFRVSASTTFFIKKNLFIYLFLAVGVLRCHVGFSLVAMNVQA